MDQVLNNLAEHGPWGLAVAILAIANAAQWKHRVARDTAQDAMLAKCWDELRELSVQTANALVELNMLSREQRRDSGDQRSR